MVLLTMPERPERLFWLYAKQADDVIVSELNELHHQFVSESQDCSVQWTLCVDTSGVSDRLWLFRLQNGFGNDKLAQGFNVRFKKYIDSIPNNTNLSNRQLSLKRRSNLPTPLITQPIGQWPNTDLGLHAVNDVYNGMLITYTYYQGRYTQPPHLQVSTFRYLLSRIESAWQSVVCDCRNNNCSECNGSGCYSCFQQGCVNCEGTGWKDFLRWKQGGYKINYSSGFPIANL